MAFDYTTLTGGKATAGSVASWVNSDSVPAADIIADTEEWLGRFLRVRRMETRKALSLAEGDAEIDLATEVTDFLDPIRLHMHGYGDLDLIPDDDIDRVRATDSDGSLASSAPVYWTIVGRKILFDCEADQDYSLVLTYYGRPAALSAGNTTNLYTEEWRVAFKFAAMAFAYVFLKDEQRAAAMFASAASQIAQGAMTDDMAKRGAIYNVEVA